MSVLPVCCFDPRYYGKSSSGFDKTGPYRASFLIESVSKLRKNLQAREAVYAHREVSHDEVKGEEKIETALKDEDEGVEVKYFWGSTLYHIDDLPFKLEEMPTNYVFYEKRGGYTGKDKNQM
ncbi:hypothetical protein L2E82_33382 [Cichorium intybus]|uniref:Uncharacterized protein n=1 Tax=Cichorium intybus TaxID=13427 RepID=A0ACB9BK05_CICIN|nr:hypothetical protein L2E82_33382 [Cichorium intybus]